MCGRLALSARFEQLAREFGLAADPGLKPRYNVAPTQPLAVIRSAAGQGRELVFLRWGLIPFWAKDASAGARFINARAETAAEKPAFRLAFQQRRALIPASGFFEWSRRSGRKEPFFIRRSDGKPLALAGIWEIWRSPEGETVSTSAILTTVANSLVGRLHDRMPVVVAPDDYRLWLDPSAAGPDELARIFRPCPEATLEMHSVSPRVNSTAIDEPGLVEPYADGQLSLWPGP